MRAHALGPLYRAEPGYGEAKVQHEGGSMAAVNDALRACLQKAQADLDRELTPAQPQT